MGKKAVLFDLDGTLLPMDLDAFVRDYFGRLSGFLALHGYDPKLLIDTVWAGTAAMVKNDGSMTNEERFWQVFNRQFGDGGAERDALFDEFYDKEFDKAAASCGYDPDAAPLISELRHLGYRVILATNPIFPPVATQKRIGWAGLSPEDFELITTYTNSRFTKLSIGYYRDILSSCGLEPEECLMVGNDVGEDMVAKELGMHVFLVPRDLVNRKGEDISVYPQGTLAGVVAYLKAV